jgi:hypothetical protein
VQARFFGFTGSGPAVRLGNGPGFCHTRDAAAAEARFALGNGSMAAAEAGGGTALAGGGHALAGDRHALAGAGHVLAGGAP